MTEAITETEEQVEEQEPVTPGSWCQERYGTLMGRGIAEEVLNEGGVQSINMHEEEERAWWSEFYGDLSSLDLRDMEDVGAFLQKYYGERVGDMEEQALKACAKEFTEVIWRAEF